MQWPRRVILEKSQLLKKKKNRDWCWSFVKGLFANVVWNTLSLQIFLTFYFKIILDLQKLQRLYREFFYTLNPASPNVNILQNHGKFIETKKFTSVQYF